LKSSDAKNNALRSSLDWDDWDGFQIQTNTSENKYVMDLKWLESFDDIS